MIIQIIGWLAFLTGLTGCALNARKLRTGFYWWIISDVLYIINNLYYKNWPLTLTFILYTIIAIYGLNQWKEN